MPDRVVYLVNSLPKRADESSLEFVDDEALGILLSQGWETGTTIPDRTVKVGSKSVKATMMVLKMASENRGMVMRDEPAQERRSGGTMVTLTDEYGQGHSMNAGNALAVTLDRMQRSLSNLGDTGHLGGAKNHSMPGLQIISGEHIAKAWDMGMLAARAGHPESANPWAPATEVGQRWLAGYRKGGKASKQDVSLEAAQEAQKAGYHTAKDFGPDDEVTCPYPKGSPLREHWINGFKSGGGRIEE